MINYNVNNRDYLLSIKPSYKCIPLIILLALVVVIVSICLIRSYDVFVVKGYITYDSKFNISIGVDLNRINDITSAKIVKLNDKVINYNNIIVGDIQIDEINKINIQNVNIEVEQLDVDVLNTFQEVKIYSNYESIFNKIKKIIL